MVGRKSLTSPILRAHAVLVMIWELLQHIFWIGNDPLELSQKLNFADSNIRHFVMKDMLIYLEKWNQNGRFLKRTAHPRLVPISWWLRHL